MSPVPKKNACSQRLDQAYIPLKMNGHRAVICVTNDSQWNTYWSSVTISLGSEIAFTVLAACEIFLPTLILVSF